MVYVDACMLCIRRMVTVFDWAPLGRIHPPVNHRNLSQSKRQLRNVSAVFDTPCPAGAYKPTDTITVQKKKIKQDDVKQAVRAFVRVCLSVRGWLI